jgi:hypothetical protein
MTRFRTHPIAGTVGLAALVALAAPASAYFSGLAGWAGPCAQSQGMAPGCGQIPPQPRGPAIPQISPEEQQIEEQQRRAQQEELDRLQQQREEQERQAREAEADDLAGLDHQTRGDLQGAIDKFIAALDLAPGNATIKEHLRRANIALAAVQSSAAIDALRHRIENAMVSARISALQKDMEAKILSRRLVAFYNSFLTAQAAPSQAKVDLNDANVIRAAIQENGKPPFQPLWDHYQRNRTIAEILESKADRCAMVLSMTLGLEPGVDEHSFLQLPDKSRPEIEGRYYLRAQELAGRLLRIWGHPEYLQGRDPRSLIRGRRGVIYLEHAYLEPVKKAGIPVGFKWGDHIDLWDRDHLATPATEPFEKAREVWFWEIP